MEQGVRDTLKDTYLAINAVRIRLHLMDPVSVALVRVSDPLKSSAEALQARDSAKFKDAQQEFVKVEYAAFAAAQQRIGSIIDQDDDTS